MLMRVRAQYSGGLELRAAWNQSCRLYWIVGLFSLFSNLMMLTGPIYMLQVYGRVLGIPQDRPLLIVTRIDPLHIDKIDRGKRVTLRFTALDQRTTPELEGVVSLVSADSFEDDGGGASYYRAEIFVEPEEMAKLAGNSALIPGMPVETFIRTADRSPLSYLLKPIVDYFNRAFRES